MDFHEEINELDVYLGYMTTSNMTFFRDTFVIDVEYNDDVVNAQSVLCVTHTGGIGGYDAFIANSFTDPLIIDCLYHRINPGLLTSDDFPCRVVCHKTSHADEFLCPVGSCLLRSATQGSKRQFTSCLQRMLTRIS